MRNSGDAESVRQRALALAREGVETERAIGHILKDCGGELESIIAARRLLTLTRAHDTDPLLARALRYLDEIINRHRGGEPGWSGRPTAQPLR
jgi:hypothetical protein